MVYLTEHSFRQLIEKTEIKIDDRLDVTFFITHIYNNENLYWFFNQFELKKLLKEKTWLSDNQDFEISYKEVPERKDNLNYVIEMKGKVKYHYSKECDALNKGFKNFFMPEAVVGLEVKTESQKLRKKEIVTDIRNWFKIQGFTIEEYENGKLKDLTITKGYNRLFPKKYELEPIFISDKDENQFKWYISKKSGNVDVEKSFNYGVFLDKITDLIIKRDYLCSSNTMKNLSRYDYLYAKNNFEIIDVINQRIEEKKLREVSISFIDNYGIENLKCFWKKHLELKNEVYNLLSDYFKWTYNFKEKQFDELTLETFNLEGCSKCKNLRK